MSASPEGFVKPPTPMILDLGGMLFGIGLALILTGFTTSQASSYYITNTRRKEPFLKAFVGLVMVLIFFSPILSLVGLFETLIQNFGNYGFKILPVTTRLGVFLAVLSGILCQFWLLYRVHVVAKKQKWVSTALLLPVMGSGALSIYQTVVRIKNPFASTSQARLQIVLPLSLCWTVATDLALSGTFIFFIYRNAQNVLQPSLQEKLKELVNVSVQACIPTTTFSIIALILSRVFPEDTVYVPPQVTLGPLYVFSMLYTLNSRPSLPQEECAAGPTTINVGKTAHETKLDFGASSELEVF
ncbi:hypothetical protein T439DRAFT_321154 [Meredithblackwellia eburnea MCA 4105]